MVLATLLEDIYYKSNLRGLDLWMFEILLVSYFNLKFFNFKIFSHHNLAIYINIIFGLIYKILSAIIFMMINSSETIPYIYIIYKNNGWIIPFGIIFYLLIMIPRAYAITKIKVFMDLKNISTFKLLISYGFIGTLICSLVGIISTFTKCPNIKNFEINFCKINNYKNETYFEYFSIYYKILGNKKDIILEIIIFLSGIITNFFYILFYLLTIKYLTPMHIIFLNIIYTTFLRTIAFIIYGITNDEKQIEVQYIQKIINYFGLIVQLIGFFALLIYLEIIVLNFCKFNYNLRESIIKRSSTEYELNKNNEDNYLVNDNEEENEDSNNKEIN